VIWLLAVAAMGAELDVCLDGSCDHTSIADALVAASADDTIWVGDGIYRDRLNIDFTVTLIAIPGTTPTLSNDSSQLFGSDEALVQVQGSPGGDLLVTFNGFIFSTVNARPFRVEDGGLYLDRSFVRAFGSVPEGGALWMQDANLHTEETVFDSNVAGSRGGHIFAGENSDIILEDRTVFVDGRAGTDGGAIYIEGPGSSILLIDARFDGNRAFNRGGAIHADGDMVASYYGGSFTGNQASEGGAVSFYGFPVTPTDADIRSTIFTDNTADAGGAIWGALSIISLQDTTLIGNTAGSGGAVFSEAATDLDILRTTFCANSAAPGRAGAVFYRDLLPLGQQPRVWSNNRFIDNAATLDGGAVIIDRRAVNLHNNTLFGNRSSAGDGSAVKVLDAEVDITDNLFAHHNGLAVSTDGVAGTAVVNLSYNAWWLNQADHARPSSEVGRVTEDPAIFAYVPDDSCSNDDLRFSSQSPLVDAGTIGRSDPDGSPRDIGYLGGLGALNNMWTDLEPDGALDVYDCDPGDVLIGPHMVEQWYDGIDSNCDRDSDFDQDGDGYDSDQYGGTDCDDLNAQIHPGAPDPSGDGIDNDCVGGPSVDGDLDGFPEDVDCLDDDPRAYPGAEEFEGDDIDSNCDGFRDPADPLVPSTCSHAPAPFWLALVLPLLVRRRHG